MEIKIYRHKVYKDIYLKRNWNIGGSSKANWWDGTKDMLEALKSYQRYENNEWVIKDVEKEYKEHFYDSSTNHSKLEARITLKKTIDFDGYTGTVEKELVLPLNDFELIILKEVGGNE